MPIIEVGAPKLGMTGGGFIDPRQAVEDAIKDESDSKLLKAVSATLGAVFTGTQQHEAKLRKQDVVFAESQINESIGRVKQGYPEEKALEYITSGEWAPEGFAESQPKEYQRLMDQGVERVAPGVVSFQHSQELSIRKFQTNLIIKNFTTELVGLDLPGDDRTSNAQRGEKVKQFLDSLSEEDQDAVAPYVESIVRSSITATQIDRKENLKAARRESAYSSVSSATLSVMRDYADGNKTFLSEEGKVPSLREFIEEHLEAAIEAGGKVTDGSSKVQVEKHARGRLEEAYRTLVAWEDSQVAQKEKQEFTRQWDALGKSLDKIVYASRGSVDQALADFEELLETPYWNPGEGEGRLGAVFSNRNGTRIYQLSVAREMVKEKKKSYARADKKPEVSRIAGGDIYQNLPQELVDLQVTDPEAFVKASMEWAKGRVWDDKTGEDHISSGTITVDDLGKMLSDAASKKAEAAAAAAANALGREAVTKSGQAGIRGWFALLSDEPDEPDEGELFTDWLAEAAWQARNRPPVADVRGFDEALQEEVSVYLQLAPSLSKSDQTAYRSGVAGSYRNAIRDIIPHLIASGEIILPAGGTPKTFLQSLATKVNSGLVAMGVTPTKYITEIDINAAMGVIDQAYTESMQRILGDRTTTAFLNDKKKSIPDEVLERMRQTPSGSKFTLGGTELGRARAAARHFLGQSAAPPEAKAEFSKLIDGVDEIEEDLDELLKNPNSMYVTGGNADLKKAFRARVGLVAKEKSLVEAAEAGAQRAGLGDAVQSTGKWNTAYKDATISDVQGGAVPLSVYVEEVAGALVDVLLGPVEAGDASSTKQYTQGWVNRAKTRVTNRRGDPETGTPLMNGADFVQDAILKRALRLGIDELKDNKSDHAEDARKGYLHLLAELEGTRVLAYADDKLVAEAVLGRAVNLLRSLVQENPGSFPFSANPPSDQDWTDAASNEGMGNLLDELGIPVTDSETGDNPQDVRSANGQIRQLVYLSAAATHGHYDAWPEHMRSGEWIAAETSLTKNRLAALRSEGVLESEASVALEAVVKFVLNRASGVPTMSNHPRWEDYTVSDILAITNQAVNIAAEYINNTFEGANIGRFGDSLGRGRARTLWAESVLYGSRQASKIQVTDLHVVGDRAYPKGSFYDHKKGKEVQFDAWGAYQDYLDQLPEDQEPEPKNFGVALRESNRVASQPVQVETPVATPPTDPPSQPEQAPSQPEQAAGKRVEGAPGALASVGMLLNGSILKGPEELPALRQILIDNGLSPGIAMAFDSRSREMTTWGGISEFGWYDAQQVDPVWHNGAFLHRVTGDSTGPVDGGAGAIANRAKLDFTNKYLSAKRIEEDAATLTEGTLSALAPFWQRIWAERGEAGENDPGKGYGLPRRVPGLGVGMADTGDMSVSAAVGAATVGGLMKGGAVGGPGGAGIWGVLAGTGTYVGMQYLPQATLEEADRQYDADSVTPAEVRLMVGFLSAYGQWSNRRKRSSEFRAATLGDITYMEEGMEQAIDILSRLTTDTSPSLYIDSVSD